MTVIQTYHTILNQIQHIVPTGHLYRQRTLAWFMTGIYHSRAVHTSKVANKIPGQAKRASSTRRLSRFLANGAVRVRRWYEATVTALLQAATQTGQVRLIIDKEEMFGDFKRNGADLQQSRLRHFLRLSRLTLVVALLYVWIVAFGSAVIKRGDRHLVDRADRRDLSIFRIGYDMLERCLINNLPVSLRLVPFFT